MKTRLLPAAALLLLLSVPAFAGPVVRLDMRGGMEYLAGDNTYEIGGKLVQAGVVTRAGYPVSRLEFPLDVFVAYLDSGLTVDDRWQLRIKAGHNVSEPGQKMKDSDWLYGNYGNPSARDIYSESDPSLDAWTLDVKGRFKFLEVQHGAGSEATRRLISHTTYSFFGGLGYEWQDYSYKLKNAVEYDLTLAGAPKTYIPGEVLRYDLTYHIPYAELGFGVNVKKRFNLDLSLGGSVLVHAEDKDNHVIRGLTSSMDTGWDGEMFMGNATARYNFTDNVFCTLSLAGKKITVDGTSHAHEPPNQPYTIEEGIESSQTSVSTTVGYNF
jgi:outer membrane protease